MGIKTIRVSDLSNTEATEALPVESYVVPNLLPDGTVEFYAVDLTAEEFSSLVSQVTKATGKYVRAGTLTELVVTEPKRNKHNGSGIDWAPVRAFANEVDPTTGKARFSISTTGRVPSEVVDAFNAHVAKNTGNQPSTVPPNAEGTEADNSDNKESADDKSDASA